ncbi:hypothetical protein COCC4DRAFT_113440, partial [Bipolaris maydis ATCC 48331]
MPRSSTIWAAALLMASMSGSGPLLTTAEAMPAPGPGQAQDRPRYYIPRHVKREDIDATTPPPPIIVEASSMPTPSASPTAS